MSVARAAGRVGELAQVGHKRSALAAQELERAHFDPAGAAGSGFAEHGVGLSWLLIVSVRQMMLFVARIQ